MDAQSQVMPFSFNSNPVRAMHKNGQAWFVAQDIADALHYRDARDMVRVLDEDEADTHTMRIRSGDGTEQNREVLIINESGIYHALFKSRKKEAAAFRKWVTTEVLPSIRKTGSYQIQYPETQKALPSGLSLETQDEVKELVRIRLQEIPKEKQRFAAIKIWSAVNAKFGTKGQKEGYKNIPEEMRLEVLSLIARVPLTGELMPPSGINDDEFMFKGVIHKLNSGNTVQYDPDNTKLVPFDARFNQEYRVVIRNGKVSRFIVNYGQMAADISPAWA